MTNIKPMTLRELAELLADERSPAEMERYLKRHWEALHRRTGLPRKLGIGWLWPRAAVEGWLQGYQAAAEDAAPAITQAAIAANQNRSLAERYAGGRA